MTSGHASSERTPRFRTVDGLRGIAAASVAVFHFHTSIARVAPHWIPDWLAAVAGQGAAGVEVFFVISGFVIAFSVRDGAYSAKYLGLFAIRRSIRLDPPYWVAIAMELVLIVVSTTLFPSLNTPFPSAAKILSHLVYAQGILGYGDILPIFWTLCFEIQFYLLFVGLLVFWERLKGLSSPVRTTIAYGVLGGLFVVSLMLRFGGLHLPIPGLAVLRWFQFFLGVLAWWVISRRIPLATALAAYAAVAAALVAYHADALQILPVVVSGFLIAVGYAGRLETMLSNRVLQFLGKISYSLYLFHGPLGERWISLLQRIAGSSFGTAWAYFAFISAFAISIAVSTAVWRLIEVPTTRLSKKIRLESRHAPIPKPVVSEPPLVTASF